MLKKGLASFFILFIIILLYNESAYASEANKSASSIVTGNYLPEKMIVGMKASFNEEDKFAKKPIFPEIAVKKIKTLSSKKMNKNSLSKIKNVVFLLEVNANTKEKLERTIKKLKKNKLVAYREPNYLYYTDDTLPNDPDFAKIWALNKIDTPKAWDVSTGDRSIKVAILDTGVDYRHKDLKSNVDISGSYDFVDNDKDPMDENAHGTHIAGIIGAVGNDGIGITGVNWQETTVPIRVADASGVADGAKIVEGINLASKLKVPIIHYSISGDSYNQAMEEAIKAYGGLFVAAAGNEGHNLEEIPRYPASLDIRNMVVVGNVDGDDTIVSSSNYSKKKVDLFAPGFNIYSTVPNDSYDYKFGASMSTPHVAGAAALALAANKNLTTEQLKELISNSVDKISGLTDYCKTGGRLNAGTMLQKVAKFPQSKPLSIIQ